MSTERQKQQQHPIVEIVENFRALPIKENATASPKQNLSQQKTPQKLQINNSQNLVDDFQGLAMGKNEDKALDTIGAY